MSTLAELTPADQALKSTVHAGLFITFVAAAAGFYVTKIQKTENIRIPLGGSFNISTDLDKKFKRDYLVAYLLAMLADWLQGPYVYALYAFYGFSKADNGLLFIFGFGSSAIFGTFIGGFADKYGRKKFTIMYGVIYALSCCTKHFNNFTILVVGRLLAGIATSLLYSVFEAWLVCEHTQRGFGDEVLSDIFSLAILGNSLVAICAGFVAQFVSDIKEFNQPWGTSSIFWLGGYATPFDLAAIILGLGAWWVNSLWTENTGKSNLTELEKQQEERQLNEDGSEDHYAGFKKAWNILKNDKNVLHLGLMIAFFESSMFIFVFLWTPAITQDPDIKNAPYGLIFALFMMGCMLGSTIFGMLQQKLNMKVEQIASILFLVAAFSHGLVVITTSAPALLSAFVLFEVTVGLYFPCMGMMKGKIVPESCRSTLYNFFRVPLNLIVVLCLVFDIPVRFGFLMTAAMLGGCVYLLRTLDQEVLTNGNQGPTGKTGGLKNPLESGSENDETALKQVVGGNNYDLEEGEDIAIADNGAKE